MSKSIKNQQSMALKAFRLFWKCARLLATLISDDRVKMPYTAGKAQELYDADAISGIEYAKNIHGE